MSIDGHETLSQASQDLFVMEMLKRKSNGVYLEIGASEPFDMNNTAILEQRYGWRGVSFELDKDKVDRTISQRTNPCYCEDATGVDYGPVFEKHNFPKQIDYLSLDIEPHDQTLLCLKKLPLDDYRFSVITYEHDAYCGGSSSREESRKILTSHGYILVVSDVCHCGNAFEDWYVDPTVVDEKTYSSFFGQMVEHSSMFTVERKNYDID